MDLVERMVSSCTPSWPYSSIRSDCKLCIYTPSWPYSNKLSACKLCMTHASTPSYSLLINQFLFFIFLLYNTDVCYSGYEGIRQSSSSNVEGKVYTVPIPLTTYTHIPSWCNIVCEISNKAVLSLVYSNFLGQL